MLVSEADTGTVLGCVAVHWLPYLIQSSLEGYVSEMFVTEAARGMAISRSPSRLMLVNRKTRESYRRGFYRKLGWEEREEFAYFVLPLPQKSR